MPQNGESQASFELQPADGVVAPHTPVWPMVPGVAVTAFALDVVVSWLRRGSLPRFGLVIVAASLLFSAVMVCGFVVRGIYSRLLPGSRRVATPVVRAACLTALWIPAWVLFMETWSLLMIASGAICLLSLGYFLKRCHLEAAPLARASVSGAPFLFDGAPLIRVPLLLGLLPSLVLVLLLDVAIALAATRWFVAASMVSGVFAGVLAWRASARSMPVNTAGAASQGGVVSVGRQAAIVVGAFFFTVIALLPYLRVWPLSGSSLFGPKMVASGVGAPKDSAASSTGYPGIIMLPLAEQQKKIVAPVKREFVPHFGVKIAEPMEILFDGQYWYFKWPEKRPRSTARVVRGSSTKTQVSSSDRYPLLMEAHQKLAQPLDLGCCSAMDLVVENGDRLEGVIALELWVKKLPQAATKQRINAVAPEQAPHYLGTVAIPSSEMAVAARPNASGKLLEEKLRFPIPEAMDGVQFDEITVVVRPAPERAKMGAKVAIRKFVLEP